MMFLVLILVEWKHLNELEEDIGGHIWEEILKNGSRLAKTVKGRKENENSSLEHSIQFLQHNIIQSFCHNLVFVFFLKLWQEKKRAQLPVGRTHLAFHSSCEKSWKQEVRFSLLGPYQITGIFDNDTLDTVPLQGPSSTQRVHCARTNCCMTSPLTLQLQNTNMNMKEHQMTSKSI